MLKIKKIFKSKIFFALGCLILLFVTVSFINELLRREQINSQIESLEQQSELLAAQNVDLLETMQYLNSPQWHEKEARTKLNLKKPAETIVITGDLSNNSELNERILSIQQPQIAVANPNKWLNYFLSEER